MGTYVEKLRPIAAAPVDVGGTSKVEVNDHGVWRASTVLKRDGDRAFIHYDGWNDHWDEWVGPDRMRPVGAK